MGRAFEAQEPRPRERHQISVSEQAAVGEFCRRALADMRVPCLSESAASLVAQGLAVDYAAVLKLLPEEDAFLVQAGVGWKQGIVGRTTLSADVRFEAGYALRAYEPVITRNWGAEERFGASSLLRDHTIASGIVVSIPGPGVPFGVLGAYDRGPRSFGDEDGQFLQDIAGYLGMAIAHSVADETQRGLALFPEFSLAPLLRVNRHGEMVAVNRAAQVLLSDKDDRASLTALLTNAETDIEDTIRRGLVSRREIALGQRYWQFTIRGLTEFGVAHAYGSDVTELKRAEEELAAGNRELLTMHRISETVRRAQSLEGAYQEIVEEISDATGFPIVVIELYDEARKKMLFKGMIGIPVTAGETPLEIPVTETLSGIVARTGQPMVETSAWERSEYANETLRRLGVRTFVCVPMLVGQRVVGVLSLAHPGQPPVGDRLLPWVESLASYVASATERRHAEEALKESEQHYRALFEDANDAILLYPVNSDGTLGRILKANRVACGRLGYSQEELLQMTPLDIVSGDTAREVPNLLSRLNAAGRITFEAGHRARDGRLTPVEVSVRLLDIGGIQMVLSISRDISERKRVERLRDEWVSLISHDMRSPLTIILGQASMLERALGTTERTGLVHSAEAIRNNAKRMSNMIDDLVDSARLESGKFVLKRQPVNLQATLREVVENALSPADQQRIRLDLPDEPLSILGDVDHLQRVVVNLASNALKYSDARSPVDVRLIREDRMALLSITDFGVGIGRQDLPRLFARFYRVRTAKQTEGLGLGLYICRLIVDAHDGHIWAESTLGKGSTFHVSLPLVE